MNNVAKELNKEIGLICKRQGMYTGDENFASFTLYFCGILHGTGISGFCGFSDWRNWVYKQFGNPKDGRWETVLLDEYGNEGEVMQNMPALVQKFTDEFQTNA
jgi:hypothetical protein